MEEYFLSNTLHKAKWYREAIESHKLNDISYDECSMIKRIGRGSFGRVYRCLWMEKLIVLKEVDVDEEDYIKDFLNELHSNARNERIVKFIGLCHDELDDCYYLVTEYANDGNLREYLKNKCDIAWSEKIKIATQIAEGISYIHNELNVVHHNLHTKNVLIHHKNIKIADFGFSKSLNGTMKTGSNLSEIAAFLEPRKIVDSRYEMDTTSDIYSVGVIFWEISSRHPPFQQSQIAAILLNILQGMRERPVIGTPTSYIQLYSECWGKQPEQRPSASQVLDKLHHISLEDVYDAN